VRLYGLLRKLLQTGEKSTARMAERKMAPRANLNPAESGCNRLKSCLTVARLWHRTQLSGQHSPMNPPRRVGATDARTRLLRDLEAKRPAGLDCRAGLKERSKQLPMPCWDPVSLCSDSKVPEGPGR
jgi:hypothetical protein